MHDAGHIGLGKFDLAGQLEFVCNGVMNFRSNGLPCGNGFGRSANLAKAFEYGAADRRYFGLFFQNKNKPRYDNILHGLIDKAVKKDPSKILDSFLI